MSNIPLKSITFHEIPNNTYTIPQLDSTLSVSGEAADAKATGDAIGDLKSSINDTITKSIPCSFSSGGSTANLTLSGYTGKKVFVSNKNLLPQFPSYTNNGITFTPNADGSLSLSGTATGAATAQLSLSVMPNLGAGTYTLSCGNAEALGDNNTYLNVAIDRSYAAIYARLNSVDGKTTFTVPEGSQVTAIRIRISASVTVPANFKIYPQCEEGTEKTAFVKHEGTVLEPTSASVEGVAIFQDYTYICAQSGVTGGVTFDVSRIDDLDVRVTALENAPNVYHKFVGKRIVCFGDSITGNYQPPDDYPSMIAEITGATVYNAGFGGCCMSDNGQIRKDFTMCRLADAIVGGTGNYGDFTTQRNSGVSITYGGTSIDYVPIRLTMLESIDWTTIDYITIAYGTNDWNGNYGLDNENDPDDTTTYIGAFRYAIEKILTKFPNIKVMVITPLWRWWDTNTGMPSEIHTDYIDSNDYAKGTGYKLWQYGDALVEAAKWYHIPVFDLYWNCMMTKQNRFEYFNTNDGTHPKHNGIVLMSEMISAHMVSVY